MGETPFSVVSLLLRVLCTLWLFTVAYSDARAATISNKLTLPAVALLGSWRLFRECGYALGTVAARMGAPLRGWLLYLVADVHALSALVFMLLAWGFCFAVWELHILGGGDAKTLMGIVALFPTPDFAVFLAVAVLILSLPLLVLSLRGKRLSGIPQALGKRLEEGHLFPTQQDLAEHGRPYAWTFCLPAAVYLWLLW